MPDEPTSGLVRAAEDDGSSWWLPPDVPAFDVEAHRGDTVTWICRRCGTHRTAWQEPGGDGAAAVRDERSPASRWARALGPAHVEHEWLFVHHWSGNGVGCGMPERFVEELYQRHGETDDPDVRVAVADFVEGRIDEHACRVRLDPP